MRQGCKNENSEWLEKMNLLQDDGRIERGVRGKKKMEHENARSFFSSSSSNDDCDCFLPRRPLRVNIRLPADITVDGHQELYGTQYCTWTCVAIWPPACCHKHTQMHGHLLCTFPDCPGSQPCRLSTPRSVTHRFLTTVVMG